MTITSFVHRLKLQNLIGAVVIASVAVTSIAHFGIVQSELQRDQAKQALDREQKALNLAATLLASRYPGIKVSWDGNGHVERIAAESLPDLKDNVLVDEISRATEDPATIFALDAGGQDFIRVSTTVKKKDGSRAIGTYLGKKSAAYEHLMMGSTYHGEANILDVPYYTVYKPIFDLSGKVIGVLFSGVKRETITTAADSLISKIWKLSAALTIFFAAIGMMIARFIIAPLSHLSELIGRGENPASPVRSPYGNWKNEIGRMARAIETYSAAAALSRADLQRRHRELLLTSEDLAAARDRADQANEAKSSFLANMSHEFRTPMHAILNYTKISLKHAGGANSDKLRKSLSNIQSASIRLISMINNLLDLAKLESGIIELAPAREDLLQIVRQSYAELEPLADAKSLRFNLDCASEDTWATFDRQKLTQIFINIFSNAIKFSPQGGVISVRIEDVSPGPRKELYCVVRDDGCGIPEPEIDAIFDKFVQSSATRNRAGGSGLGLAICREIASLHGGKIWATNERPHGAALHLILPKQFSPMPLPSSIKTCNSGAMSRAGRQRRSHLKAVPEIAKAGILEQTLPGY